MNAHDCPMESKVAAAARHRRLDSELRSHAASCEICGSCLTTAEYLGRLAEADGSDRELPDPRVILLKSELLRNAQMPEQLMRRSDRASALVWGVVAVCWAALLGWRWSDVREIFARLNPSHFITGGGELTSIPMLSIIALALMALVTFAITFHQVLAEE